MCRANSVCSHTPYDDDDDDGNDDDDEDDDDFFFFFFTKEERKTFCLRLCCSRLEFSSLVTLRFLTSPFPKERT